jgi:hypothetical protein
MSEFNTVMIEGRDLVRHQNVRTSQRKFISVSSSPPRLFIRRAYRRELGRRGQGKYSLIYSTVSGKNIPLAAVLVCRPFHHAHRSLNMLLSGLVILSRFG